MCNCKSMARTPEETSEGKYPLSNHHPNCEDFKTEKFYRVTVDNTSSVFEPKDTLGMFDDDTEFDIETIYITRDQFEKLPEFTGW